MRFLGFFALGIITLYMVVATFVGNSAIVGRAGIAIYNFQTDVFGYLGYFYLFPVFYFYYIFYTFPHNRVQNLGNIILYLLGFISALLFQGLTVEGGMRGEFGGAVVDFLSPFIGIAGVWFVWVFSSLVVMLGIMEGEKWRTLGASLLQKLPTPPKKEEIQEIRDPQPTVIPEVVAPPLSAPVWQEDVYADELSSSEEIVPEKVEEVIKPSIRVIPSHERPINRFTGEIIENPSEPLCEILPEPEPEPVVIKEPIIERMPAINRMSPVTPLPTYEEVSPTPVVDVPIVTEIEENKKLLDTIERGRVSAPKNFVLPPLHFLAKPEGRKKEVNEGEIDAKIKDLLEKLSRFKIEGDVVCTYSGPIVTTFEFKPAPHIKVSRILQLQDDIAMALKAQTIRIQAPVPGKDVVGIEIPNNSTETIYLREVLESDLFKNAASPLTLAVGKDIVGNPFITDLKKLPHLLIAGTTGSGKSVGINAMILSLLYRNSPDDLRLLMVDPKMLEFSIYNDIPHLLTPVITKPKQAVAALANMVKEMESRYYKMAKTKTKNIDNYNDKAKREGFDTLPFIVVIIDELADLMMTSGKDVELSIARLAQMARAAGIHLIVATQRPSVDVVTGLIKANLPSRISYRVGQKIDSKVIIDQMGAESLLGKGDMLFTPPGSVGLVRLHAPWSSEDEIDKICEFIRAQREPNYDTSFLAEGEGESERERAELTEDLDEMFEEAKQIVLTERKTSISYIQRRLQIGYNRAARIVEQLEATGIISEANNKGLREVL